MAQRVRDTGNVSIAEHRVNNKYRWTLEAKNEVLVLNMLAYSKSYKLCTISTSTKTDMFIRVCTVGKGGQTAILVRWSAAQRTTEKLADQRQRTTKIELPLFCYSAVKLFKISHLINFLDSSLNMNKISSI
jgi:hypothetical protein